MRVIVCFILLSAFGLFWCCKSLVNVLRIVSNSFSKNIIVNILII